VIGCRFSVHESNCAYWDSTAEMGVGGQISLSIENSTDKMKELCVFYLSCNVYQGMQDV
jgi:hypothetical protein